MDELCQKLFLIGLFTSLFSLTALSYFIVYKFGFTPWFDYSFVSFLNILLWATILWVINDEKREVESDGKTNCKK